MRMRRLFFILIFFVLAVASWYAYTQGWFSSMKLKQLQTQASDFLVHEIQNNIRAPEPLRATLESKQAVLTRAGVIKFTNTERATAGLTTLKENAKLDTAAQLKLRDMFTYQYFAHVSPAGIGPSHWPRRR